MTHLSLSLLGSFRAMLDGEPIADFEANKVRALLIYLAVEAGRRHPGRHPRQALATLLWPHKPERAALANLRNALANLRSAIGDREAAPPFLRITRETIQFDPASDHWLDVTAFQDLVEAATDQSTHQQLQEAVALYRGDFLEGFFVRDSPQFEDWVLLLREKLHWQVLQALDALAAYYEQHGAYTEVIACARRQVALEPWQESAHRQLMRALALSDDRAAALMQYETCRHILAQELNTEPEAETQALYERIRDGKKLRARSALPPHNLSAQLTPFVGRTALLAEIGKRIADPTCRLLTLIGSGGSGKTRLALEAAKRVLSGRNGVPFDDGVYFVPLDAVHSIESMVSAIGQAIGFAFYQDRDPRQQLFDYLRNKRMLLILDNMEHLVDPPLSSLDTLGTGSLQGGKSAPPLSSPPKGSKGSSVLVTDILSTAPSIQIVTTSRTRLNVRGEYLVPIEGMHYPRTLSTTTCDLDQYSAIQLFLASAREIRPITETTAGDLAHVARICQLVEGTPLAILLAAAWMPMLSPAEIADEITQTIDFLATDWQNMPERQRSMRAVFDHSWQLLSDTERELFARMSVFRGGFTRDAAQKVTGASLQALMALANRSLLHRTPTGRYEVHELLRQYATEKLKRYHDAGTAVCARHAAYYAAALARWAQDLKGPRQMAALGEIEAEIANACAAWEWAAAQRQASWLEQAADGLARFYIYRNRLTEGMEVFRAAAERLLATHNGPQALSSHQQRVLARMWTWEGHMWCICNQVERASQLWHQSQERLAQLERTGCDVRPEKAFLLWQLTMQDRHDNDLRMCRSRLEQSLALYRELSARWETASVLRQLGGILYRLDHSDQAMQMQREALVILRELSDSRGIIASLTGLSGQIGEQGHLAEAECMMRESLALAQTMGDPFVIDRTLRMMYLRVADQGRFAKAYSLAREALETFREHQFPFFLRIFPIEISDIELHLGRYAEARLNAEAGLALLRNWGSHWMIGDALRLLGEAAMAEGDLAKAESWLQGALAEYFEPAIRGWAARTRAALGGIALLRGNTEAAQPHLGQALRQATESLSRGSLEFTLPFIARLLAQQGQVERAAEIYALASRSPYVANSRFFHDMVGQYIVDVTATLPPKVREAAYARGQARDLWETVKELLVEMEQESKQSKHWLVNVAENREIVAL